MVMSGTPRAFPTTRATPFWYQGRANIDDTPPLEASGLGPASPKASSFWATL